MPPVAVAAVGRATLHLVLRLQPWTLRACPDNSSSRGSVLISGPRNLKVQFMVLCHRGFHYCDIKSEVLLVPGVCSGVSGKGDRMVQTNAGQPDASIPPPRR